MDEALVERDVFAVDLENCAVGISFVAKAENCCASAYSGLPVPSPEVVLELSFERLPSIGFGPAPTWFLEHRVGLMTAPESEMGQRLPQLLFQKIENPAKKLPTVTVPFGFDQGSTIGPAPRANA